MNWHTRNERRIIRRYGGRPRISYGYDGTTRGRPVEVREARKDSRYRIQRNVHQQLVRQDGSYIFVSHGRSRRIPAKQVSGMMGSGPWYRDRRYPHKFVRKRQVFR